LTGPVRINGQGPPTMAAPPTGADTEAVLGRLGLSTGDMAALRADKVV
jgi:crotonobetainyl-CoA:carnitine CoA-transferase CaiB-like acyl-CoA transferase